MLQTGPAHHGLRTYLQHGSQQETPSPRWAPELTHQPSVDFGSFPQLGNSQNPGSSPFHRRFLYIAPRPAHTAPPTLRTHVEMSADPVPYVQKNRRRPRSPATKEREAMAKRSARNLQKEAYAMQRIAHAEGRQIRYPILTNPDGEIIGNRGKWQVAVRSIVELTVDRSIREYRKEPQE